MRVVIAGGGKTGRYIAHDLHAAGHEVTVLEASEEKFNRHVERDPFRWVLADACEPTALRAADLSSADVVVAATGDDEDNLVVSLLAKQEFAVPRVIARVNHPSNEWMFTAAWGVDVAVSTPHLMTALVEEAVSVGDLVQLLTLEGGRVRLVEVTLADDSPAVGKRLGDLTETDRELTFVAVVRDGLIVHPRPETVLEAGDEVMALATEATEHALLEQLTSGR